MFNHRFLVLSSNASITIVVITYYKNIYADNPMSLFDSTQKLLLFLFVGSIYLSTDYQLIIFRILLFQHTPELSKEVDCRGK